jgi:DNA-directed RNA polymerase subunit H (RpoH/RPB5)
MQRLLAIKKTQIKLVSDRGYTIPDSEIAIETMSLTEFTEYLRRLSVGSKTKSLRNLLTCSYTAELPDKTTRSMLAYFGSKDVQQSLSVDVVRNFFDRAERENHYEAILITDAKISHAGVSLLAGLTLTKWQVFSDIELTYNPVEHVDTPRHELLSPQEAQAKLIELKVDPSKLLILKAKDPVVKYYGWTVGSLVRIHRDDYSVSILSPKSINYRIIVG